jgi:hypothetical protein
VIAGQGDAHHGRDADSFASHNFAPFLDANPHAAPAAKYKVLGGHRRSDGSGRVLYAFSSPDGLHWQKLCPDPVLTQGAFDSLNVAFWDGMAGAYRCYSRTWVEPDGSLPQAGGLPVGQGARGIQSCTSPDFVNWSQPQANTYAAGAPIEEFYTNATVPAPAAEHLFFSFPMRFVAARKKIAEHPQDGVSDAVFMSSRDGAHWHRIHTDALIRPGRDPRNWTDRSNMVAWGLVTAPTELSLYVSEHYRWPDNRLRRYSLRPDGFASLYAAGKSGEWTTKPLRFTGENLRLNYSTSAAGAVRVEVQNAAGQPLGGYELEQSQALFGDELDAVARWRNRPDLAPLRGQTVRLRFEMAEADLYALQTR